MPFKINLKTITLIVLTVTILFAGCINNNPVITEIDQPAIIIVPTVIATPIITPTVEPTPIPEPINLIDLLVNDLTKNDPGNRNHYVLKGNLSETHTHGMMCIEICEYIINEYNYTCGMSTMTPTQGIYYSTPFVWVIVNNSEYIINPHGNEYCTKENYLIEYNDEYKIIFIPLKKAKEFIRVSDDSTRNLNNNDNHPLPTNNLI